MKKSLKTLSATVVTVLTVSSLGSAIFAAETKTKDFSAEKPGISMMQNMKGMKNMWNKKGMKGEGRGDMKGMGIGQKMHSGDCNFGRGQGPRAGMEFFEKFSAYLTTEEKAFLEAQKTKMDELRTKHQAEIEALGDSATSEVRKALRDKHQTEMKAILDSGKTQIEAIKTRLEANTEVQAKMKELRDTFKGHGKMKGNKLNNTQE